MKRSITFFFSLLFAFFAFFGTVKTVEAQTARNPVLEYVTGTWCQYCPCGHEIIRNSILKAYPNTIVLGYHAPVGSGDPFANFSGNQIKSYLGFSAYPTGIVDRTSSPQSRGVWFSRVTNRIGVDAAVQIEIGKTYNTSTRQLDVTLRVTALEDLNGQYKINLILTEDSLFAGQQGSSGCPGGSNYRHDHVVRSMINGPLGEEIINGTLSEGDYVEHIINYTVPNEFNERQCHLTALVYKVSSPLNMSEIQQGEQWELEGDVTLPPPPSSLGSVRKIVLLEEATNASCAPCAANNPGFQEFFSRNFGGVVSVRYHASWPGFDPMYDHNTADNDARISYYGISGVPNYVLDGVNGGVPSSPGYIAEWMHQQLQQTAPVYIGIDTDIDADSVRITVELHGVDPVTATNLYLRTAIIERLVEYQSAPGNNGEKEFADVMRKLVPSSTGEQIDSIPTGSVTTFTYSIPVDAEWDYTDLAVVTWLQSDATKEVIQSNIDHPTYIMHANQPRAQFLELNQNYEQEFFLHNDNDVALNLRLKFLESDVPAGWSLSLLNDNGMAVDSFDYNLQPGDTLFIDTEFSTNGNPGTIKYNLFAQNLDDDYGYGFSLGYFGVVKSGNILFVDDDGNEDYEQGYFAAFDSAGVDYTPMPQEYVQALEQNILSMNFAAVFWNCSWGFPAFVRSDIGFLNSYLAGTDVNLFIAGQDIGWDIFDAGGSSNFPDAQTFYHDKLDADYVADNSGGTSLSGVAGTFMDGISFSLNSVYAKYPEDISARTTGEEVLEYPNSKFGAITFEPGTYKSFYMGIGLEQITDEATRIQLIQRLLDWMGLILAGPSGLTAVANTPGEVNLEWSDNATTEDGYIIERKEGDSTSTSPFSVIDTVAADITTFTDATLPDTVLYYTYRVVAFSGAVLSGYSNEASVMTLTGVNDRQIPVEYALDQNYPNPFNPVTNIKYQLPFSGNVTLKIYDVLGNEVATLVDGYREAGYYNIEFDASHLGSGVYFYRVDAGKYSNVKKMMLLK